MGIGLSVGAGACSSAPPPPPVEPVAAPPVASAPPSVSAPSVSASSALPPAASAEVTPPPTASPPPEPPPAAAAAPESGKLARSPIDIITSPDTAFLINYASSAPIEAARRTCAEKSGGDPGAQAKCLSDARDAFKADVIRFRKDGAHWSWTVYKRAGNRLDEVSSGRVALTEASPSTVNVKFVTDKGMRPLLKNKRETVLSVPNDYSFEVDDADWGNLKYEAKIGLVGN